jgi:hypothetical protein
MKKAVLKGSDLGRAVTDAANFGYNGRDIFTVTADYSAPL